MHETDFAEQFESYKKSLESCPTPSWVALAEAKLAKRAEMDCVVSETSAESSDYKDSLAKSRHEIDSIGKIKAYELRDKWSGYVQFWFYVMIGIQAALLPVLILIFYFSKSVSFNDIKPFIYLVSGENFVNILALVFVIVKYLFPPQVTGITSK